MILKEQFIIIWNFNYLVLKLTSPETITRPLESQIGEDVNLSPFK